MNSVSPKRHIDGAVAPLMFININNKHELFAVPKEYPYKQSGETISDDQQKAAFYADMVYPILPKIVKTPRRTLVPFSSASNEEQDITFNTRLDIEVLPKIEQIVNGEAKDLDPLIQDTTKCLSQVRPKSRHPSWPYRSSPRIVGITFFQSSGNGMHSTIGYNSTISKSLTLTMT